MNFDAFYYILESLTLNEVITCRQVCHQWKDWIDQYLRTQTTILICFHETRLLNELYAASQVFELNYDEILAKRIHIPKKELSKKSFVNSVVSMFPNILHFYFCSIYDVPEHISFSIHRKLFYHWRDLETLMIYFGQYKSRTTLIEHVNELESLETLIVIDEESFYHYYSLPKNAKFLTRVKKLYVPCLNWVDKIESLPNITSLATRHHENWERYREMTDRKLFPNVEAINLILEMNIMRTNAEGAILFALPDQAPDESNERLNDWIAYFKEKNYENIRLLSFVDLPRRSIPNIGRPFYNDFLKKLGAFKQLRILKFDASHINFFESILSNAQFYPQVKELHILIKFMVPDVPHQVGLTTYVDMFRKAFPSSMRSIEKVFLRPVKWMTISKDINKVVSDYHSYQVIFLKPLEYNSEAHYYY